MRTLGNFIEVRCAKVGFGTVKEFIAECGLSRATIYSFINAKSDDDIAAGIANQEKVAETLRFGEWQELVRAWRDDDVLRGLNPMASDNTSPLEIPLYPVPEYNLPTSATHWAELEGDDDAFERNPRVVEQGLFRIRIHGDCMEPAWLDGELIEFKIWRNDGLSDMPIGQDVVVTDSDNRTTFKTLLSANEDEIVLRARNPKYPDKMRVPMQMVARIGVAQHFLGRRI